MCDPEQTCIANELNKIMYAPILSTGCVPDWTALRVVATPGAFYRVHAMNVNSWRKRELRLSY
jgi:hypothetical protein